MENDVLIAMPTRGKIHYRTASWLVSQKAVHGFASVICYSTFGVVEARIKLVYHFLKNGFTHLFFCDDDMEPGVDCIRNLLIKDEDIISARYMMKNNFELKDCQEGAHILSGVQKVDRIGLGACLIKRAVLERFKPEDLFSVTYKDGEIVEGEDHSFCRKVKEAGFEVNYDFANDCEHYKEVGLNQLYSNLVSV